MCIFGGHFCSSLVVLEWGLTFFVGLVLIFDDIVMIGFK